MGDIAEARTAAQMIVADDVDGAKEILLRGKMPLRYSNPETFQEGFWFWLAEGLRTGERGAGRIYAEVLGWIGAKTEVNVLIAQQFGVPIPEAKRAVQTVQAIKGISESDAAVKAAEWLKSQGWTCLPPQSEVNGNGNHP